MRASDKCPNKKTKSADTKQKAWMIAVLICVISFVIFVICMVATSDIRYRNRKIAEIQEQINEGRETGSWGTFYFWLRDEWVDDPVVVDFLISKIEEMWQNKEGGLLSAFIFELELRFPHSDTIYSALEDCFLSADDKEFALRMQRNLENRKFYNLNQHKLPPDVYYKNEGPLGEYIRSNGINSITLTPGKGYYADRKDYSYSHDVGIEGTPLYDAGSVVYMGDFMIEDKWGVHLNKYYEETEYRNKTIYFRDYPINFDWYNTAGTGAAAPQFPETDIILEKFINNDKLVWSGDYLFLFSDDGVLIDWCELK